MPKFLQLLLALLISSGAFSQNSVTLTGKIIDKTEQFPLEAATVYLSNAIDSTLIDYTITDKNGAFSLATKKSTKPIFLRVSYVGYQDFKQDFSEIIADKNLGSIQLEDGGNTLNEVIVKSEAPPIRIKNDTLEFNAASFKLRPDANVEALLKQLPGVEIDSDGKITVNGKEVNQILVNGKPFFDKDGKVALQNLPSEIINKVQITDSKTKKEEISGAKASSNEASINLTIDEDKNKGFFGKFTGGYGTDDRYESSMLVNYFKNTRKISILGSSNNINATGFSMNEIFDSMGGGRNSSVYTSDDGSFGINGMRFGGGKGITRSNMFGTNYADQWFKDFDSNVSYFYTSANAENVNRTRQQNLLPGAKFTTESNAKTVDDKFAHNFNTEFEYKIDSTATLNFSPKFVKALSKYSQVSDQVSTDENGVLLNRSDANSYNETENTNFENNIYFYKSFKKKGRSLSAWANNENSKDEITDRNISNTTLFQDENNDGIVESKSDNRNQTRRNRNLKDEYGFGIEYQEPMQDSLSLKAALDFKQRTNFEARNTFDFNPFAQDYSVLNDSLTSNMLSRTNTLTPSVGINLEKSKFNLGANLGTDVTKFEVRSLHLGNNFTQVKDYILPSANIWGNYRFTKSKSIWISYNYQVDFPDVSQVAPVINYQNPLNTSVGNPDLDPNKSHSLYGSFRDYDYATKSGYSFYGGGNYYDSQYVASTVYDESRKRNTTYKNISGSYSTWFGGNYNKSIKKEAHSYKFSLGLNGGLTRSKGFANDTMFVANALRFTPRVSFTYDYGELVSINPSYNFSYANTKYENYQLDRASNVEHKFNIQTTTYWPKHVVFGNDFGYTYNSNIADGFKKDFYLWNASLGYNFFGDKLLAKVKVYDMLNQNLSTSRTITSTTIRDEQNIVLKRYAMFSLTYKIEKFGGKKKSENHWWD